MVSGPNASLIVFRKDELMHSAVKILTVQLAVNLASGLHWVEKTVRLMFF